MTYKPKVTTIGAKGSEPTDAEIKGRPITICDTADVVAVPVEDAMTWKDYAPGPPLFVANGEPMGAPELTDEQRNELTRIANAALNSRGRRYYGVDEPEGE